MGESKKDFLRVSFDNKLMLEFHGVKVTGDDWNTVLEPIIKRYQNKDITCYFRAEKLTFTNTRAVRVREKAGF